MSGRRTTLGLAVGLAIAAIAAVLAQVLLQRSFAAVDHPVSLAEANITADAATVRGWYRVLVGQGTLDQLVFTERIDYLWMIALGTTVVLATLLAARLLRFRNPLASRRLRRLAPWTALAPGIDGVENVLSLIMLSDPFGFPDHLAVAHAWISRLKLAAILLAAVVAPGYALAAMLTGKGERDGEDAVSPRLPSASPD